MSTRRRAARLAFWTLAVVAAIGSISLVAVLVLDQAGTSHSMVALMAWVGVLTSVMLAVAAAQESTDPDDDPRYLATVLHGLVDEWRR